MVWQDAGSQGTQATCSLHSAARRSAGCSAAATDYVGHLLGPLENVRRLSLITPSANQLEWQPVLRQLRSHCNYL